MHPIKLLLFSTLGFAFSNCLASPQDYGEGVKSLLPAMSLDNRDGSRDHWQGIGRLTTNTVCTATLLDTLETTGIQRPPAYVLTAGHCINLSNGKIMQNQPVKGTITFNYFSDSEKLKTYNLKKVKWRSMQGVDMAIVELDVSLKTLMEDGIKPLKLATRTPAVNSEVLVVGAPEYKTLEMTACTLQSAPDIIEEDWVWRNNFMTRCQSNKGGVSGAPLLDRYTNEIIGVVGTGNAAPSLDPCYLHAPCILTEKGYSAIEGNLYGNLVPHLRSCFRSGFLFENHCELYPTFNVETDERPSAKYKKIKISRSGAAIAPTWDYQFSIDTAFYRHKTVRVAKQCESPSRYSAATSSKEPIINNKVGSRTGRYFLCIIGTNSPEKKLSPGLLRNALSLPVELIEDEVVPLPDLSLRKGSGYSRMTSGGATAWYSYKVGPSSTTDCQSPEGFNQKSDQLDVFVYDQDLPAKLCSVAFDEIHDRSEVRIDHFDKF
ncbi:trypsin-like serine peptidase [Pseudomonas gozinkensis]|uniref:trypsin-like serine peptidase n=1 Tax=Pseudomonas gozinkensis TaxID=2774461 RepID=UPI00178788E0|nr:serine protease [Pseudomonas gozinkensis]